jgi:quinol monooxygenase YgiN
LQSGSPLSLREGENRSGSGHWAELESEYVMDHRMAVVARFKAMKGMDQKLKELLLTLIEPSRSDEGCISYELHQAINDPAVFIFYEIWQSKEYLDKHSATSHVQHFRSKAKDLFAEPPQLTLLTKISS